MTCYKFQLSALMVFSFAAFANILVFDSGRIVHPIYIYLALMLILTILSSSYLITDLPRAEDERNLNYRDILYLTLLVLFAGVLRFFQLGSHPMWLDEYSQAGYSYLTNFGPVLGGALQQQPPLDYIFSQVSLSTFGLHTWALRFFPAIWGSLCPMMIAVTLIDLGWDAVSSVLVGGFVACEPDLIFYSQEGRPYSLGLLLGVVYSFFLFRLLKCEDSRALPTRAIPVVLSGWLFLMSIGFQSGIVLVAISAIAVLFLISRRYRRVAAMTILSSVISVLLFAPFLCLEFYHSRDYLHRSVWQRLTSLLDLLHPTITANSIQHLWLCGVLFVMAATINIFVYILNRFNWVERVGNFKISKTNQSFIILAFLLLYTALFFVFYSLFVNWPLSARYFLFFQLAVIAAWTWALRDLIVALIKNSTWQRFIFAGLLAFGAFHILKEINPYRPKYTSDYRSIYAYLDQHAPYGSVILPLTLGTPKVWTPDSLLYTEFYLKHRWLLRLPRFRSMDTEGFLTHWLPLHFFVPKIYFIAAPEFNSHSLTAENRAQLRHDLPSLRFQKFLGPQPNQKAWLIILPVQNGAAKTLARFYRSALSVFGHKFWTYYLTRQLKVICQFSISCDKRERAVLKTESL